MPLQYFRVHGSSPRRSTIKPRRSRIHRPTLSTDRPAAFDRGAIPWRSIDAFAARYGLVGDDFDRFVRIIRAMDAAYLDYFRKPLGS